MLRLAVSVLVILGCGAPREVPQGPGPVPPPIVPPDGPPVATDVIDSGTFVTFGGGREEFTIRKRGEHLVMTVRQEDRETGELGPEGELVVDAQFHPVSAKFSHATGDPVAKETSTVTLGGSPLVLEEDGRYPRKVVATGPIDVFVEGPGYVALTALCRVQGDVSLRMLGDREELLEAYVGAAVGNLRRIVLDIGDHNFEMLCDGDKLVAGALFEFGLTFVRKGRESALAALDAAPRPGPHAWKRVQNPTEPWQSRFAWMLAKQLIVVQDSRSRESRLVTLDAQTGKKQAERIFKVSMQERAECEQLPGARLVCGIPSTGELKVLDGKTLVDVTDLGPTLAKAIPNATEKQWSIDTVKGDVVSLVVGDQLVYVDTKKSTATVETKPWKRTSGFDIASPFACSYSGTTLKLGKDTWTLDVRRDDSAVKKNGKELATIPVRFGAFLACKPPTGAAYVISYGEHSILGVIDKLGKLMWQVPIDAHPLIVFGDGNRLYVTTEAPDRRVIAVDAKAKKIVWP